MAWKSEAIVSQGTQLMIEGGSNESPVTVSGITKANPAVITATAHGLADGDLVTFAAVTGMTEINTKSSVIEVVDENSFKALDIDSTDYTTYGSGGTATPVGFLEVDEARNFNGFDGQAGEIDVSTMKSSAKEYRPDLQDFGAFNFSMNFVPADPAMQALQTAKRTGATKNFRINMPGGLGAWVFQAFVRQLTIAAGVGAAWSSNVVLRITGEPLFIEGGA